MNPLVYQGMRTSLVPQVRGLLVAANLGGERFAPVGPSFLLHDRVPSISMRHDWNLGRSGQRSSGPSTQVNAQRKDVNLGHQALPADA